VVFRNAGTHGTLAPVKLSKPTKTDAEMLLDFPRPTRSKDWFMRVTEIARGGYVVTARDRWGREVTHTGSETELAQMIEDVERYAASVSGSAATK
jgi:hypothetical protein